MAEFQPVRMEVHEKLVELRKAAGMSRDQAADALGISRSKLARMETSRKAGAESMLLDFARLYNRDPSMLSRKDNCHTLWISDFQDHPSDIRRASEVLSVQHSTSIWLENLLEIKRDRLAFPEIRFPHFASPQTATHLAMVPAFQIRQFLGILEGPLPDLGLTVPEKLDLDIYQTPMDPELAGILPPRPTENPCLLVNDQISTERQLMAIATLIGYRIVNQPEPVILKTSPVARSAADHFAKSFALELLMPVAEILHDFSQLCHRFSVDPGSVQSRLRDLEISLPEDLETNHEYSPRYEPILPPVSERIAKMARKAWDQLILSEGQLSEMLDMNRIDLRKMLDNLPEEFLEEKS